MTTPPNARSVGQKHTPPPAIRTGWNGPLDGRKKIIRAGPGSTRLVTDALPSLLARCAVVASHRRPLSWRLHRTAPAPPPPLGNPPPCNKQIRKSNFSTDALGEWKDWPAMLFGRCAESHSEKRKWICLERGSDLRTEAESIVCLALIFVGFFLNWFASFYLYFLGLIIAVNAI
jgi:hypothetical protein